MDLSDRESEPHFTRPYRQIILMLVTLGLVAAGVALALPTLWPVFSANLFLNGIIFGVFLIGVAACFSQVFALVNSAGWIEGFVAQRPGHELTTPPSLLAPLAALLRSRGARTQIGATSARSILDSVATRVDEGREITRYLVSLLIFLGLLGTFYGLATTVPGLVETIQALAPAEGESGVDVFGRLQQGLETQLSGMGVAFASSLLGLAGSLVVGLLEIFAAHGQNRFYRDLEEWLSSITRVGFASGDNDMGGDNAAIAGLLDHMAEQMEAMQMMFTQNDISRSVTDEKLERLAQALEGVGGTGSPGDAASLAKLVDGQERLIAQLQSAPQDGVDAESRMRLRSIDVQLLRILEEISAGRQESVADLRGDLAGLTQALQARAGKR
ncbi:MAG: biopolymer transporter ExbB [Shimia sp.]